MEVRLHSTPLYPHHVTHSTKNAELNLLINKDISIPSQIILPGTESATKKMAESADFLLYRRLWRVCLLSVSCNFVADGAKTEPKAEDSLEVEPLVCRVRVMVLRACPGVSTRCLSGILCVGYSSVRILRNSLMGYAPVILISLSWNTRK